jgi:hypothetical protein
MSTFTAIEAARKQTSDELANARTALHWVQVVMNMPAAAPSRTASIKTA